MMYGCRLQSAVGCLGDGRDADLAGPDGGAVRWRWFGGGGFGGGGGGGNVGGVVSAATSRTPAWSSMRRACCGSSG